MDDLEKAYWNNEVAEYLEIGESTLRKWCIELEKNGYQFSKGAMESRAFTDIDLAALHHFKQLLKGKKHTREQAAKSVIRKFQKGDREDVSTPVTMENIRSIENMLKLVLEQQQEFLNRLDLIEKREQEILECINHNGRTADPNNEPNQ